MEYRNLDITLISAKDIKNVNLISKMDVYALVWIEGGDPRAVIRTPVDKEAGPNPTWNFSMKFAINEAAAQQNRLTLVIRLRSQRDLGDRDIGDVRVPIKEIIGQNVGNDKVEQLMRYQVKRPDGRTKGELNLSYKFSDKITGEQATEKSLDEPVTAYPAKHAEAAPSSGYQPPPAYAYPSGGYPPQGAYPPVGYPQQGPPPVAGYGYPPQQPYGGYPPQQPYGGYPYGHPPPQQGYGYPPVQQPPKKSKFGGGLGMGLLGGALGGMLIGDMISDVGAYDAGYEAGFDDAGDDLDF
ncbi:hypothetical protein DCAR_0935472 [Daucus carota subsp. sativus]|uniref:C2 domain-containing protein n=1 Tax=Daucus carota subsp. sativus TaxID=79200 RepID=A0A175YH13_DAUCS|nr:PREDICTED: protein SRC2-like [Daucus carota subsp. sativus]WOH15925.1 hypothetical protein DCAR_0935472 [Daucus carota subsp. sativus]